MLGPKLLNLNKPVGMTSYDVVREIKKNLPFRYEKIGHFGTLDPFASGVLLLGFDGALRLNDLIHDYLPKTYLAVGKLGTQMDSGDRTGNLISKDESVFFKEELPKLPQNFLQGKIKEKFLGPYAQVPPFYSATKFEGRPLHEWARKEGILIKKDPVLRHISRIEVVKYDHPYLSLRVEVSSGTYIRTLFEDVSHFLGTHGHLIALVRESIGKIQSSKGLSKRNWPKGKEVFFDQNLFLKVEEVLPFEKVLLKEDEFKKLKNGNPISFLGQSTEKYKWVEFESTIRGLGILKDQELKPYINFKN